MAKSKTSPRNTVALDAEAHTEAALNSFAMAMVRQNKANFRGSDAVKSVSVKVNGSLRVEAVEIEADAVGIDADAAAAIAAAIVSAANEAIGKAQASARKKIAAVTERG